MAKNEIKQPVITFHTDSNSDINYSITYEKLNVRGAFEMKLLDISCSTIQMSWINVFYTHYQTIRKKFREDLQNKFKGEDSKKIPEEVAKYRLAVINKLKMAMSLIVDEKVVLFSTTVNDAFPDREFFFDEVSDFIAVPAIENPNTGNDIKIWGFYTDAKYDGDKYEEEDDDEDDY